MTNTSEYESTHSNFQQQLKDSQTSVDVMELWFTSRGDQVYKPDHTVAPTRAEWNEHSDDGDLYVNGERIEVRHLVGTEFTNENDWPHQCFYVESVHAFDQKEPRPRWYYHLNPLMTHAAVTDIENAAGWRRGTFWHKTDRKQAKVYIVNLSSVRFIKL
jgi:hypothetical protein